MDPISLLKEENDYKSAISASALFWAISSIVVLILKPIGIFSSYVDALPFVIVISWLAGEIAIRTPKRIPIAYCPNHGWRLLPDYPFSRLWMRSTWKYCVECGSELITHCERNNHLLSVYDVRELPDKEKAAISCTKCGDRIGEKHSIAEFRNRIYNLSKYSENLDDRVGDVSVYEKWKSPKYGPRNIPIYRNEKLYQQLFILNELKEILNHTEFDLLVVSAIDDVIMNMKKKPEPYMRQHHEDEMIEQALDEMLGERRGKRPNPKI